jgi:hypothetical protein
LTLDIGCLHGLGAETSARAYAAGMNAILKPGGDFLLYAHASLDTAQTYPAHGLNPDWVRRLFTPALEWADYCPGVEKYRKSAWYRLSKPASLAPKSVPNSINNHFE